MDPMGGGGMPQPGMPQPGQPPMPGMPEGAPQEEMIDPEAEMEKLFDYAMREANIAKRLKKKKTEDGQPLLEEIGQKVYDGYEEDLQTVAPWLERNKEYLREALLLADEKSYPWPGAANVKYPLIATAAMQFAARAYPSLVPNDNQIVKPRVIGYDPDGSRLERAVRIGKHMSYQIMYQCENWEEDMDRLLTYNPVVGVSFKKTYVENDKLCSKWLTPDQFIINYHAETVESAYRKTELVYLTKNQIIEKVRRDEEFLDVLEEELENGPDSEDDKRPEKNFDEQFDEPGQDEAAAPHLFLCQYTYLDLDDDGYEEPYMVVVHARSRKVVRIVACWSSEGVEKSEDGEIISIKPIQYFTKFGFIPNPDSAIYDNGFGYLLGSLNDAINTVLNQLIDAGSLSNLQSGVMSKSLRIKMGDQPWRPGEWKVANATADEIKGGFVPLPVKDPSPVLFNLLNLLIESGNKLASIAEIFTGKMPGQNTPATTTQETVEQGMKVFTAIYKRLYRALYKEFKKIYGLNRVYESLKGKTGEILNVPMEPNEYDGPEDDIIPSADPTGDSAATRMQKYQQVTQLLVPLGVVNVPLLGKLMANALEIPQAEQLIVQPPPPAPDPKVQAMEMKGKIDAAKHEMDKEKHQMDMVKEMNALDVERELGLLKAQLEELKMALREREGQMKLMQQERKANLDAAMDQHAAQVKGRNLEMESAAKAAQHEQTLRHKEEMAESQALAKTKSAGGRPRSPAKGASKKKGK